LVGGKFLISAPINIDWSAITIKDVTFILHEAFQGHSVLTKPWTEEEIAFSLSDFEIEMTRQAEVVT
jgi:hypothetical protein